ncbi:hypothetical protein Acr_20g0010630 [Actinidia rufa]|uniref:Uncharacterized protein n=1 Tax=Actinidia rufa TaxID=165716 RepID=A0A7J0GEQ7_9ERIC|nr:hypothetical protein Acr_20g0010630 [Actinidia rufa]
MFVSLRKSPRSSPQGHQGTPSLPGPDATTIPANLDEVLRPIPLFDSPPVQVPPTSVAQAPLKVYTDALHRQPFCQTLLRYLILLIYI